LDALAGWLLGGLYVDRRGQCKKPGRVSGKVSVWSFQQVRYYYRIAIGMAANTGLAFSTTMPAMASALRIAAASEWLFLELRPLRA